MKKTILSLALFAGTLTGVLADDVFFGHYSTDPTIGTFYTKQIATPQYWVFQEVFKDFTAQISLNTAKLGNSVSEGWASNVSVASYGMDVYADTNKTLVSSHVFDNVSDTYSVDLKDGQRVSFWLELSDGTRIDTNNMNIREYSYLAINAGSTEADSYAYAFYAYGNKTQTPLGYIVVGDGSRIAAPAGQPLPGALATCLVGALGASFYLKRQKKKSACA